MSLTPVGSIVRPVGLVLAASIVQLPSAAPVSVYLNTLSAVPPSSTTQKEVPSVTMPLGLVSPLASPKPLVALWLPERRAAAPAYRNTLSLPVLLARIQTSDP